MKIELSGRGNPGQVDAISAASRKLEGKGSVVITGNFENRTIALNAQQGDSIDMSWCDLMGANIGRISCNINLSSASLDGATLTVRHPEKHEDGSFVPDLNLTSATMENGEIVGATKIRLIATGADMRGLSYTCGNIVEGNFMRGEFQDANFSHTHFRDCEMTKANFEGANFKGTTFSNCNMEDAYWDGVVGHIPQSEGGARQFFMVRQGDSVLSAHEGQPLAERLRSSIPKSMLDTYDMLVDGADRP